MNRFASLFQQAKRKKSCAIINAPQPQFFNTPGQAPDHLKRPDRSTKQNSNQRIFHELLFDAQSGRSLATRSWRSPRSVVLEGWCSERIQRLEGGRYASILTRPLRMSFEMLLDLFQERIDGGGLNLVWGRPVHPFIALMLSQPDWLVVP